MLTGVGISLLLVSMHNTHLQFIVEQLRRERATLISERERLAASIAFLLRGGFGGKTR